MIKFLCITIGTLLGSVGFLYYLVNNSNFLPQNTNGSLNIINFLVFLFLAILAVFCFTALVIFCIRKLFAKPSSIKGNIVLSIRQSALITVGVLIAFLLHVFHIMNFVWGIAIIMVVILSIFVI